VKWFDKEKGYGFIAQANGDDIFFHRTGLASGDYADIQDNTRVTYCIEHTEKGPQAVDIERLDAPEE
jgi:CspA family cold shock protein